MEEVKQTLEQGQGVPYLSIFNGQKKAIMDLKNNMPIGMLVTSFDYQYDEEDGDLAEIVIETDNIDLLDQPDFHDKATILLQWGYILPNAKFVVSPVRKVILRDTEWEGTETGVRLTLKCTDLLSLMKDEASKLANDDFETWLAQNIIGIPYAKIIDYKKRQSVDINGKPYHVETQKSE